MSQKTMFDEQTAAEEVGRNVPAEETVPATEDEMTTVDGELVDENGETITVSSLYGDDADVAALAERVILVAPWANYQSNGQWKTMSTREVSLVIRRCMALGVDPLNPHEVQIWRDRHGVQFQLAYTLMAEWVRYAKGGHTEPRYTPLTSEEMELEGLEEDDHATWCTFIMLSDIPNIAALTDAGFDPQEARGHFLVRGIGTVAAAEWSSKYFGPNGRSKRWTLRKRALVDAYRMRFGTPSRASIELLRRQRGEHALLPSDFDHIAADLPHHQQLQIAHRKAARRNGIEEFTARDQALPAQPTNRRRDRLFKASAEHPSGA